MSLNDMYLKRLNRYGNTFQERVQGQRESDFNIYKQMSTYRAEFELEGKKVVGTLEPNKQDETETSQWLLTDVSVELAAGTLIQIDDTYWMVWWLKNTRSKGYNKYCVLKMTHLITWKDREQKLHTGRAYFFGKMDRIIYDIARNTASSPNYQEPNKETHLIMPKTLDLRREDYIEIDGEGFIVDGYDISSVPGVIYISLKQTYIHDHSLPPETDEDETFWFKGAKV